MSTLAQDQMWTQVSPPHTDSDPSDLYCETKIHTITPLKGQSNYQARTPRNRLLLICSFGLYRSGWYLNNHFLKQCTTEPFHLHCSSLPSILWLFSRGTTCYAFALEDKLIEARWDLFPCKVRCHSTTYGISFFPGLSNWCACPSAQTLGVRGLKRMEKEWR